MSHSKIENYDDLKQIAPDLFCIDSDWQETRFRRRMTIIRLTNGELVIHNAVQLKETDYAKLDQLGTVAYIVAPNAFHGSEAHCYTSRYPNAKLYTPKTKVEWPTSIRGELDRIFIKGTRLLSESVFFHRPSKTLIVTDLVFNMQCEVEGFEKKFFKFNMIYKRFGPSKIFRFVFIKKPLDLTRSLIEMMAWDFQRVIMNHGEIVHDGGKELLKKGFSEIGILI